MARNSRCPRRNERDPFSGHTELLEQRQGLLQDMTEVEARGVDIGQSRGAKVTAGVAGVLYDDRIGESALAHPLTQQDLNATLLGEDGDQGHVVPLSQLREIERQSGPHHDSVGPADTGLADEIGIVVECAHDIDRNEGRGPGNGARRLDLAIQGLEIAIEHRVRIPAAA